MDVGHVATDFTWYNGRIEEAAMWERLDRYVANRKWREVFPNMQVLHGFSSYSG